jgi:hypothetical protein
VQDFGHFIPAFTAADVNHHVGFRVFRERLFDYGLPGAEATRYSDGTALDDGKEQIEDPLSGDERAVAGEPASERSPFADWPGMGQRQHGAVVQCGNRVRYREGPLLNVRDSAFRAGRH